MSGPLGNPRWGELVGRTKPSSEDLRSLLCQYAAERIEFVIEHGAGGEAELGELARQHHRGTAAQQQRTLS